MSIAGRLAALEQFEEHDFRAAIGHFADWWDTTAREPATIAIAEALLAEAGYTGAPGEDLDAVLASNLTPAQVARDTRIWAVIESTTQRPGDTAAIRAALAALAPDLGLGAQDRPAAILRELEAAIARADASPEARPPRPGRAGDRPRDRSPAGSRAGADREQSPAREDDDGTAARGRQHRADHRGRSAAEDARGADERGQDGGTWQAENRR